MIQLGKERGGNLQKGRGFTDCAVSVHNFTLILCMSVLALQFLCGVPTHTQLITHPKPQIAYESWGLACSAKMY